MQGVKSLISKLDTYRSAIIDTVPKVVSAQADNIANQAQKDYNKTPYPSTPDVSVTSTKVSGNEWEITASGSDTLFLEFGTGILVPWTSEGLGLAAEYPPGSWSETHGRYLTDPAKLRKYHGWWPLPWGGGRLKTKGNPPANAMYEASKTVRERIPLLLQNAMKVAVKK